MKSEAEKNIEAQQFLQENFAGVVSTLTEDGDPQSALVFYVANDDYSITFATLTETHKYRNIQNDKRVSFTVANVNVPQTIQIEGEAHVVMDEQEIIEDTARLVPLFTRSQTYTAPITKMAGNKLDLIRIKPTKVRWYDYTQNQEGDAYIPVP